MNLSIEFKKPEIQGFEWQLSQEINVLNDAGQVIAKAEIELITMNKHRDAEGTYKLLAEDATDWEIPLNVYFKKQNLTADLCEALSVVANTKAQTHILLEAISVLPAFRKQGIGSYLLQEIAKKYPKVQSINVLSMPMADFVDPEFCESQENKNYYQLLDLDNDQTERAELANFFAENGFITIDIDEEALAEPLFFDVLVASPASILAQQ